MTSDESRDVAWIERSEVLNLPMTPGQRRRIAFFLGFTGQPFLE